MGEILKHLPSLRVDITNNNSKLFVNEMKSKGKLIDVYLPFKNLTNATTRQLGDFTTNKLNFDLKHPVDILPLDAYDGSVNLVINDGINNPKLINNRLSIRDNNFFIPDHTGYKDTTIYDENTFEIDTSLKAIPLKIPKIEFLGLLEEGSGNMKVGSYVFYFKLCDADNNETEVVAESGIVQCYIGKNHDPFSMRGGLEEENSKKSIRFKLSNIDSGYNYVKVLYSKYTSGLDNSGVTLYYKIQNKYPINIKHSCDIIITGNEDIIDSSLLEIKIDYADINSALTQTDYAGALILGGTDIAVRNYEELRKMSWRIIPTIVTDTNIGSINYAYENTKNINDKSNPYCYYNEINTYNFTGYWPDEIYRFGVVYIFNDNSLSPVFNVLGFDFLKYYKDSTDLRVETLREFFYSGDMCRSYEPDNYEFDSTYRLNSRGVIKFPDISSFIDTDTGKYRPVTLGIKFNIEGIGWENINDTTKFTDKLKEMDIKGLFFTRIKRIPTILGLGLVLDMTDLYRGAIPLLNTYGQNVTKSFIQKTRLIDELDRAVLVDSTAISNTAKAMLVPGANLREGVFNDLFNGSEFTLKKVNTYVMNSLDSNYDSFYILLTRFNNNNNVLYKTTLTNIPSNIVSKTDGINYWSSVAGNPAEATKTKDVFYKWRETVPLNLTLSTSLIRGVWNSYVGVGSTNKNNSTKLKCGEVYNIKKSNYYDNEDLATSLDFLNYYNKYLLYNAICDRTEITDDLKEITCYRGDCFLSVYTHRMMWNFEDPELPTNHTIVNPRCWADNYAVRCTAKIVSEAKMNCLKEDAGWFINDNELKSDTTNVDPPDYKQQYLTYLDNLDWEEINKEFGDSPIYKKESYTQDLDDKIIKLYVPDNDDNIISYNNNLKRNLLTNEITGKWYEEYKDSSNTDYKSNNKVLPFDIWLFFNYQDTDREKPQTFANLIVPAFEVKLGNNGEKRVVNPEELELNAGGGLGNTLKALFKNTSNWEMRGISQIIRADINAVGIGQWITFPICSLYNLALRDIDYQNAQEETIHNRKRSFFPLSPKNKFVNIPESDAINHFSAVSLPFKYYNLEPKTSFLKQEFATRVYNSNFYNASTTTNEYKVILQAAYSDFTKTYGSITKITTLGNALYVIFKHGIGYCTINLNLNSNKLLGGILIISDDTGSIWKDSVYNTGSFIYGIDTVAKKIWRIKGDSVEDLTDWKLKKFLIDNLDMSEFTDTPLVGRVNVKTHYNAYKNDVIFTYYNDTTALCKKDLSVENYELLLNLFDKEDVYNKPVVKLIKDTKFGYDDNGDNNCLRWSLCFNELLNTFVTRYDWYPLESENIDNIWFSFDMDLAINLKEETENQESIDIPLNTTNGEWEYTENKSEIDSAFNHKTIIYSFDSNDSLSVNFNLEKDNIYALSFYYKSNTGFDLRLSTDYWDDIIGEIYTSNKDHWLFNVILLKMSKDANCNLDFVLFKETLFEISELKLTKLLNNELETFKERLEEVKYINSLSRTPLYSYDTSDIKSEEKYDWKALYSIRNSINSMKLWKHGQAGIYDCQEEIKPTMWYGKQHEWFIEFIVKPDSPGRLSIFNNLILFSTKEAPYKFEYEVVGESYEWYKYKPIIYWINTNVKLKRDNKTFDDWYIEVLSKSYGLLLKDYSDYPTIDMDKNSILQKLPYLNLVFVDKNYKESTVANLDFEFENNTVESILVYDKRLNEQSIRTNLLGLDISKYGRLSGNMLYLEDIWKVEIRPLSFKEAYLKNGKLLLSNYKETRLRDKYMKLKIRYTGENLGLLFSVYGILNESYA